MILICFIWFTFLYFFTFKFAKNKNIFAPVRFLSLKYSLFNLPFILMIYFDNSLFPVDILRVIDNDLDEAFFKYTIIQTIAFIFLIIGITTYRDFNIVKIRPPAESYRGLKIFAALFFFVSIVLYVNFLTSIGGLKFLINNLSSRHLLTEGQNTSNFLPLFGLSSLFLLGCISRRNKIWDKILLAIVVLFAILIFSSLGGRKSTLYLIIMMLFGYHFLIKKIEVKSFKKSRILLVSTFIVFYIFLIPLLRSKDGVEKLKQVDVIEVLELDDLIFATSYTFIDIFAVNYFSLDNAWYFKGVFDVPRIILSNKDKKKNLPPVDDGIYFKSIVEYGTYFSPPTPRGKMYNSSWPIENFGFAYANFLVLGVIIFFFLQGRIFAFAYNILKRDSASTLFIFLYVFILFNFNFSNLRITQFLLILPIVGFCYLFFWLLGSSSDSSAVN